MNGGIMNEIQNTFKQKPNKQLEKLFYLYKTRYEEEIDCKYHLEHFENEIEHRKLRLMHDLQEQGMNVTTARNTAELGLKEERKKYLHYERQLNEKRMQKKVYRLLMEYLMD